MSLFHGRPPCRRRIPRLRWIDTRENKRVVNMCFVNRALRVMCVKRCFNIGKLCLKSMFYNIFSSTFASSFSWY